MRVMRTPILVVLLAALLVPAFAAPARPELPSRPPSRLSGSPGGGDRVVRLAKGWNVVSLPLASLTEASGFPYAWLELAGTSWVERNPSVDPIDTGKAYLTWADAPAQARVGGVAGTPRPTALAAGWNLLGCPSGEPIALESLTVDSGSFHAAVQSGVLASGGYAFQLPAPQPLDLTFGEQLEPGRALAVYAASPAQVKWPWSGASPSSSSMAGGASGRPDPRAVADSAEPAWAAGAEPQGAAGAEPAPEAPSRPDPRAMADDAPADPPASAGGGSATPPVSSARPDLRAASSGVEPEPWDPGMAPATKSSPVNSTGRPDPRAAAGGEAPALTSAGPLPLPIPAPNGRGTGTLAGRVEDAAGRALRGARVRVSSGASTLTNSNGEFLLQGLPVGPTSVGVTRSGYKAGSGRVNIEAGRARRLLVRLSPSGTRPPDEAREVRTTMTVVAHRYYSDGKRYSVKRIEVSEYGGSGYWSNTYYRTYDNYVELRCPGAIVGRTYKVSIYWWDWKGKGELRGVWEPKLWKEEQREVYYNP